MSIRLNDFRRYLAKQAMLLTRERMIVAQLVDSLRSPFSVDAVMTAILRLKGPERISRATVYRTLQLLCNAGQLDAESNLAAELIYTHRQAPPRPAVRRPRLCRSTHAELIAGTCPWCGRAIAWGRAQDQ